MLVSDLFNVSYGPSLELVRLQRDPNGINFVSRTSRNNGVSARVAFIEGLEPDPAGTLSVALGGSVLETFLQPEPWYSGRDIAVLTPLREMKVAELLWWASCIRANRYRFNYGRQANRSLASLSLPDEVPGWVTDAAFESATRGLVTTLPSIDLELISKMENGQQLIGDLFEIKNGNGLTLTSLKRTTPPEGVNFIARGSNNNGVGARVIPPENEQVWDAGMITVALGGSVLSTFVQSEPFVTSYHVAILNPRREMGISEKLWWCCCIEANKYRYNYGRQANRTLAGLPIPTKVPRWVGETPRVAVEELREKIRGIAASPEILTEVEAIKSLTHK